MSKMRQKEAGDFGARVTKEEKADKLNISTETMPAIELVCVKEEPIEIPDGSDDEEFEFKFDLTRDDYLKIVGDLKALKQDRPKRIRNRKKVKIARIKFSGLKQKCPMKGCKNKFVSAVTLAEHLELHKIVSCCHLCGKIVEGQPELRKHVKMHSELERRTESETRRPQYCCDLCGKQFKKRTNLSSHMETHEDKYVDCEWCGRTLKSDQILKDHIQLHITVKDYICELCGREFSNEQLYIKHGPQHSTNHAFKCNVCFMSFHHQSTLCKHTKIHSKQIDCSYCCQTFSYDSLYRRHLLDAHDDIKAITIPRAIVKINYRNQKKR